MALRIHYIIRPPSYTPHHPDLIGAHFEGDLEDVDKNCKEIAKLIVDNYFTMPLMKIFADDNSPFSDLTYDVGPLYKKIEMYIQDMTTIYQLGI